MAEFGIVYLLPEEASRYHEQLRLDIEERFKLTGSPRANAPAHITLKYRFEAERVDEVEAVLLAFAQSQRKTAWSLDGFGTFINADSQVIFMDVAAAPETRLAHACLLQRLQDVSWMQWGPHDNADLHYHVTIANRGLNSDNFEAVWNYVNGQVVSPFDLSFDNLALLRIESGIHTVFRQYHLRDS
jgi:2'-5' RNA ligase